MGEMDSMEEGVSRNAAEDSPGFSFSLPVSVANPETQHLQSQCRVCPREDRPHLCAHEDQRRSAIKSSSTVGAGEFRGGHGSAADNPGFGHSTSHLRRSRA